MTSRICRRFCKTLRPLSKNEEHAKGAVKKRILRFLTAPIISFIPGVLPKLTQSRRIAFQNQSRPHLTADGSL